MYLKSAFPFVLLLLFITRLPYLLVPVISITTKTKIVIIIAVVMITMIKMLMIREA